jgi:hypothetical protein
MLALAAAIAGCADGRSPARASDDAPGAPARRLTVISAAGAPALDVVAAGDACAVEGAPLSASRRDGGVVLASAGSEVLRLTTARGALEALAPDGLSRARVAGAPPRLDVIDAQGVPLARLTLAVDQVRVSDAARRPILQLRRDAAAARVLVEAAGGAGAGEVRGVDDLAAAALAVAPGLSAELRALLVCDRLLPPGPLSDRAAAPSPAPTSASSPAAAAAGDAAPAAASAPESR